MDNNTVKQRRTDEAKTIKFPAVAHCDSEGNVTYDYIEIPVSAYEQWLKRCYELSGIY